MESNVLFLDLNQTPSLSVLGVVLFARYRLLEALCHKYFFF